MSTPAPAAKATVSVTSQLRKSLGRSLIIPALLLIFFASAPSWLDYRLHSSVNDDINRDESLSAGEKTARVAEFASINFEEVCHSAAPEKQNLRQRMEQSGISARFARLEWGFRLSVVLMAVLLAAIGAIWVLNRRARRSREDLIRSYRLGWRLVMTAALTKLLLLTPLLTYGLYELTVLAVDRYYPQAIIMIALGGVLMTWACARLLLRRVPLEFDEPMTREVSPDDAPELWRAVREAAAQLGTAAPDHILVGMNLKFYVTEFAVKLGASGRVEGRTLYLSKPLMMQLSPEEILAIIGHELGHFRGDDTRITREFYPMRFKADTTLQAMARSGWVGWPVAHMLNFFNWSFGSTEQAMSRERELLADGAGAELTSSAATARALVKFHVVNEAVNMEIIGAGGERPENPYEAPIGAFIREKLVPKAEFWTRLFEAKTPHPFDSHPALQVRLESLGETITPEGAMNLATMPVTNAFEVWFSGRQALFDEVTRQAVELVGKIRARTDVVAADFGTEEGRRLLGNHFPEVRWRVRPFAIWFFASVWGLVVLGLLAAAVLCEDWAAKVIFGVMTALAITMGLSLWRQHWRGELLLTADRLTYTGWKRPLMFADVQVMRWLNANRDTSITFQLKEKAPPIYKGLGFPMRRKYVALSLSKFKGKQAEMLQTIHRYFTRQIPE